LYGLFGIAALLAGFYFSNTQQAVPLTELQDKMQVSTVLPASLKVVPEFEMTTQNGEKFTKHSFQGKWHMLFFGYTHCPDICPVTLTTLQKVEQNLASSDMAGELKVVFISVDPARDTVQHLKKYMDFFSPHFIGLNSDSINLERLSGELGMLYRRVENKTKPEHYLMDHSASLLLLSPTGEVRALFSAPHEAKKISQDIRALHSAYNAGTL
jgi:protein SCO1/2